MKFTLKEWWDWWQIDDRWSKRGTSKDGLVMARIKDQGHYSKDNVYCATQSQNGKDQVLRPQKPKDPATFTYHFKEVRGDDHPKSIAIITPRGRFGSIALAAEEYGLTRAGAKARVDRGYDGWRIDR